MAEIPESMNFGASSRWCRFQARERTKPVVRVNVGHTGPFTSFGEPFVGRRVGRPKLPSAHTY
jgi:hypothetical protein